MVGVTPYQLSLPFEAPPCRHKRCFVTHAYVPAGIMCLDCGVLLSQYIPQPPEILGYVSGTWAWKYIRGREWTTQEYDATAKRRERLSLPAPCRNKVTDKEQ